jgi:chromosome segregation ATPase
LDANNGTDRLEESVPTLEARVEVLEEESTQMRDEWQVTQRVIQSQAGLLNALRETQVEHGQAIAALRTDVDGLRTEFGQLRTEFGQLRTEFSGLRTEVDGLRTEFEGFRDEVRLGFAGIVRSLDYLIDQDAKSRS